MNDVTELICSKEGCDHNWYSPGGLANVGGNEPIWRCYEHRKLVDYSAHRNDLTDAIARHSALAIRTEQRKILTMLREENSSLQGVSVFQYLEAAIGEVDGSGPTVTPGE